MLFLARNERNGCQNRTLESKLGELSDSLSFCASILMSAKSNASVNPTAAEVTAVCDDTEAIQDIKEGIVAKTDRRAAINRPARPTGSLATRILHHPKAVLGYSLTSYSFLVLLFYLGYYAARMDGDKPEYFGCREAAFASFSCGLWGIDCRPFETDWRPFRCSGRCTLGTS